MNDTHSATPDAERGMPSLTVLFYGREELLNPLAEFFVRHFDLQPSGTRGSSDDKCDEWDNRHDEYGIQLLRIPPGKSLDTPLIRLILNGPQHPLGIRLLADVWRELRENLLRPALDVVRERVPSGLWGMTLLYYAVFESEPNLEAVERDLLPAARRDGEDTTPNHGRTIIYAADASAVEQRPIGWLWLLDWPEINPSWRQSYSEDCGWDAQIIWGAVAPVATQTRCADWLIGKGSNFLLANVYAHNGYDIISQHRRATWVYDFHERLTSLSDKAFTILRGQQSEPRTMHSFPIAKDKE